MTDKDQKAKAKGLPQTIEDMPKTMTKKTMDDAFIGVYMNRPEGQAVVGPEVVDRVADAAFLGPLDEGRAAVKEALEAAFKAGFAAGRPDEE